MSIRGHILGAVALFALCAPLSAADAQAPGVNGMAGSFSSYLQVLAAKARAAGVSEATIIRMTGDLTPNSRVIQLDQAQPAGPPGSGFPPLAPYISQHVDANRIAGGRRVLASSSGFAQAIERTYGVPAQIVIAIWGHETNYGSYTGDFDLARSLATLAWEGRRRDLFEAEFIDLLKIADRGVSRSTLKGSWAGAFGNPQFLPSVYLRLAVDGDGDGRKDIWNSRADTLYSIANYFKDAGWRAGQPWGVAASLPTGFDVGAYRTKIFSPVCPRVHERFSQWKTIGEWKTLGVRPLAGIGLLPGGRWRSDQAASSLPYRHARGGNRPPLRRGRRRRGRA